MTCDMSDQVDRIEQCDKQFASLRHGIKIGCLGMRDCEAKAQPRCLRLRRRIEERPQQGFGERDRCAFCCPSGPPAPAMSTNYICTGVARPRLGQHGQILILQSRLSFGVTPDNLVATNMRVSRPSIFLCCSIASMIRSMSPLSTPPRRFGGRRNPARSTVVWRGGLRPRVRRCHL